MLEFIILQFIISGLTRLEISDLKGLAAKIIVLALDNIYVLNISYKLCISDSFLCFLGGILLGGILLGSLRHGRGFRSHWAVRELTDWLLGNNGWLKRCNNRD